MQTGPRFLQRNKDYNDGLKHLHISSFQIVNYIRHKYDTKLGNDGLKRVGGSIAFFIKYCVQRSLYTTLQTI